MRQPYVGAFVVRRCSFVVLACRHSRVGSPFDSSIGGCQEGAGSSERAKLPLRHCKDGKKWCSKKVENTLQR